MEAQYQYSGSMSALKTVLLVISMNATSATEGNKQQTNNCSVLRHGSNFLSGGGGGGVLRSRRGVWHQCPH